jgi:hypothetical protein
MSVLGISGKADLRHQRWSLDLRQLSTTERIAAISGPACPLPTCIQLLRPNTTGCMELSARLLLDSPSAYARAIRGGLVTGE